VVNGRGHIQSAQHPHRRPVGDSNVDRIVDRLYALSDHLSVRAVTDDHGSVGERFAYDAFGHTRVMDQNWSPLESSPTDWEVRLHGYRWDGETGLYQVRYRYLHPGLGRWVSGDPITGKNFQLEKEPASHVPKRRYSGDETEKNQYGFTGNNMVYWSDRFGLKLDPPAPHCYDVCKWAKNYTRNDPSTVAITVCCDGQKYGCVVKSGGVTGATDSTAQAIIDNCSGLHEGIHVSDPNYTCPKCNWWPEEADPGNAANSINGECNAFAAECDCLQAQFVKCAGNQSCLDQLNSELDEAEKMRDHWCK